MKYEAFILTFKKHVAKLSSDQQFDLALSVCKKLIGDYQSFVETYHVGDLSVLVEAIKLIEQARFGNNELTRIDEAISKVKDITPDMDDFGDEVGSYALNACNAIMETLEFIKDGGPYRIHDIASFFTDSIDFRIQEESNISDEEIDEHPLMIEARSFLLGI